MKKSEHKLPKMLVKLIFLKVITTCMSIFFQLTPSRQDITLRVYLVSINKFIISHHISLPGSLVEKMFYLEVSILQLSINHKVPCQITALHYPVLSLSSE
uniref:Secreted protein n=1 Tax=Heterorhabditis bacteriophora TaxID=37862 RepID=A0A1I7X4B8_HETBA